MSVITAILYRLPLVQRILTNKLDREAQVSMRALNEFYQLGMTKTRDQTGILIYLSMMEHQVVVLADEGISSKLPPETWQGVVDLVLQGKKDKDLESGIIAAIARCGEILSSQFPIKDDDTNELSNHLIIKS
jgi:putative membrane protein